MFEDLVGELVRFEKWTSQEEVYCIHSPVCPGCSRTLNPRVYGERNLRVHCCPRCTTAFRVRRVGLAIGQCWATSKVTIAWTIDYDASSADRLVLRDASDKFGGKTITDGVEQVLHELQRLMELWKGRRVFYYDTIGNLDEIVHEHGTFLRFRRIEG
jgi:hypothetical protein